MSTSDHTELRLSDEQLTFLTGMGQTDQLAGIGRRRPLDELEATVAARSSAARGLIERTQDGVRWSAHTERLLAPLHGERPHVAVWVRDPAARLRLAARDASGRLVVAAGDRTRRRWILQSAEPTQAIGALRDALVHALSAPSPGAWEAGFVRREPDGTQRARWFGWRWSADGSLELVHQAPGQEPELRPTPPIELQAAFGTTLAELSIVPTPAPTATPRPA